MARIAEAIDAIAADDSAQRTKRQIERHTRLSHDAVARAFRQDALETDNPYQLTARFDAIAASLRHPRLSPDQNESLSAEDEITELKERVRELDHQLDRYAMTSFVLHLAQSGFDPHSVVVPIQPRRPGRTFK